MKLEYTLMILKCNKLMVKHNYKYLYVLRDRHDVHYHEPTNQYICYAPIIALEDTEKKCLKRGQFYKKTLIKDIKKELHYMRTLIDKYEIFE